MDAVLKQFKGSADYVGLVQMARSAGVLGKADKQALDATALKTAYDCLRNGTKVRFSCAHV